MIGHLADGPSAACRTISYRAGTLLQCQITSASLRQAAPHTSVMHDWLCWKRESKLINGCYALSDDVLLPFLRLAAPGRSEGKKQRTEEREINRSLQLMTALLR